MLQQFLLFVLDIASSLEVPANFLTIITGVISVLSTLFAIFLYVKKGELTKIVKQVRNLNPSLEVLKDYNMVWKKISQIMQKEIEDGNPILLKNIGLDLEKILPNIGDFLQNTKFNSEIHFTYHGLILNPDSPFIMPLIDGQSNIRSQFVKGSIDRLKFIQNHVKNVPSISLEVHSYDFPPTLHGMLINEKHLFLGFTEMRDGKLFGSDQPYLYLRYTKNVPATDHYFNFFKKWFEYYWNYERK